jgi:glutamyl/glutaminyl-tRNA synthetase
VWGLSRALGGTVVLRVEDHDRRRCRPEYEAGLLDDLEWLGLAPDVGSMAELRSGESQFRQSDCGSVYERVLADLEGRGLVYVCTCSRRDVAAALAEREGSEDAVGELPYPGSCRERNLDAAAFPARRLRIDDGTERFDDVALGPQLQTPAEQCGDLLARDREGQWTYQFAVVVDDLRHGIDVIIRGADLLQSTGRQIRLARILGRAASPVYLHHPLVYRGDGLKLSKSDGDTGLRDLRAAGWTPERVLGEAARLGGLQPSARSIAAADLAGLFTD